jgi:hypothetical protein
MKVHGDIAKLLDYLRKNPQPLTVTNVAMAGLMNSRDAYHALEYGVRNGVIERIQVPRSSLKERVQYRSTGRPLLPGKTNAAGPSFDALLAAWGIARVPPSLPSHTKPRRVLID